MKKIVFNTDSLILGGAEKIALEYVEILSKKAEVILLINEDNGINNKLKGLIPDKVKYKYVISKETIDKINFYRTKKNNIFYKILYNYYLKKRRKEYRENIGEILSKLEYDFIFDFYCKIPKVDLNKKTITFLHSSLDGINKKKRKELEEKIEKVNKVIVVSENLKNEYIQNFSKFENKVERIYNFFDLKALEKKSNENILKQEKYILACSRLDKNKDLVTLIKAFENIKDKVTENLFIVGDGPEYKNIENLILEKKLTERVKLLGQQVNPYKWMKRCELFVHSSKKEGFGMVLVEAMSFGKNIVATDCPIGPREILDNGKYGSLVPVGDWEKLGEEILKNLEKEERYNQKNVERAKCFSKEEIKKDIYNLIGE